MFTAMDISTSALVAQRTRMNSIASNLANLNSVRNENGELEPFQARFVVFETHPDLATPDGAAGVRVARVETDTVEPLYRYDPEHPLAITEGPHQGHVAYPNINLNQEFVDALQATRAYEANIGVMEISKNMGQQTLRILG